MKTEETRSSIWDQHVGAEFLAHNADQALATMTAEPNSDGEFDWYSFDVVAKNTTAPEAAPSPIDFTMIPTDARFPGMPNQRFWMFESNELPFVDLKPDKRDLMKLIVADGSQALVALRDPLSGEQDVTSAVIHHPDLVEASELLLEKEWNRTKPLDASQADSR